MLYKDQGKFTEAKSLCNRALDIQKRVLGEQHTEVASTTNELALLYSMEGKEDTPKTGSQQSFSFVRVILFLFLSPGSFYHSLLNINYITSSSFTQSPSFRSFPYYFLGKYDMAESLHLRCLDIIQHTVGVTHPEYAETLNNLAAVYKATGKYKQSEEAFRKVLEIQTNALGPNHSGKMKKKNGKFSSFS